ncbi:hypothetical protein SIAM614_30961 [Roseibium aggregatum IAM 12614]|uniref:Uncharacterized protein n=1 Tax=Roseibium aggregatum (strain ATCC 25650 / DSM 13394 / JCM 20685 / NBRC 16684 / NCIMB 2208 / IAM 12614 / B1) TaxID=384765 RepID=A0NZA4_ROSAI|nr:hypothetical protein SIAM614_30961 [Roseibium aggregatum IAM 12614]
MENGRANAIIGVVSFFHIVCTGHLNFRWNLVARYFTAEKQHFGLAKGSGFGWKKTACPAGHNLRYPEGRHLNASRLTGSGRLLPSHIAGYLQHFQSANTAEFTGTTPPATSDEPIRFIG